MQLPKRINPNLLGNVKNLPIEEQEKLLNLLKELKDAEDKEQARDGFMPFTKRVWPAFIEGRHHKIMAEAFERVVRGDLKRLIINMPPRHTKSEFASYLLPAWFLGQYPEKKIIQTAHTAELSVGFGRKVRNLVASEDYKDIFPELALRADSKAAGRWSTSKGGEYFAIGVGGAVTGKGADLLIIDDPHSEQEGQSADPAVFDKVYDWYTSGPRQRLQPGGAIIIVMCMTGDTQVLMADGTEESLQNIRAGDLVATFDNGKLSTAKVNNWQSSGIDAIYKIQTQSSKILRANERHPFLVMNEGVLEWTRLKHLKTGDLLVSLKDAKDLQGQKQNAEDATPVRQQSITTGKTPVGPEESWDSTANGRAWPAKNRNALVAPRLEGTATSIIRRIFHRLSLPQKATEPDASSIGTASLWNSTKQWLQIAVTDAMFVGSHLLRTTLGRTGTASFASTIATTPERLEGFFVTTATLLSDTEKRQAYLNELHRTSDFTVDPIASITPDGEEEVFDVEIDRTENFIANQVVSHNTRWHKRDLTGKIIKTSVQREGMDEWELIEFPAIMPSGNALWPEFWSLQELEALKSELPAPKWNAQYQQDPSSEEGALIKREWWRKWEHKEPPQCEFIIQSWDTAFLKTQRADYSACTTWGVFYKPDDNGIIQPNIILLDAYKERLEFPELKKRAMEMYKEFQPDACIVEAKAAGTPLIFELRAMGIPVGEYTPSRGNDKVSRVNAVSDLFASGIVWCPETRFAEEVIEEFAAFPAGEHDDLVDSSTQALLRFRQGGFLRLHSDEEDEPFYPKRVEYY